MRRTRAREGRSAVASRGGIVGTIALRKNCLGGLKSPAKLPIKRAEGRARRRSASPPDLTHGRLGTAHIRLPPEAGRSGDAPCEPPRSSSARCPPLPSPPPRRPPAPRWTAV